MNWSRFEVSVSDGVDRTASAFRIRVTALRLARTLFTLGRPAKRRSVPVQQVATSNKRIGLFCLAGGGNYGNDGSLKSMVLFLRRARPMAELSCVCVDPGKVGRDNLIATLAVSWPGFANPVLRYCDRIALKVPGRLANWVRSIWHVRRFDMLIVPGTSTLCDYRSGPFGTPYGLFRWAVAARMCGVKLCFVSTGAGPILHPLSRWMIKYVAASAHYRSFRDEISKEFVKSLGIPVRDDPIYPDLVFSLPVLDVRTDKASTGGCVTFGVGVMDYTGWQRIQNPAIYEAYLGKMGRFVTSLLERGDRYDY